jgi:polysaccharide export outer membrane protein
MHEDAKPPPYKLAGGDRVIINVWNQPAMSGEVLVRSDGNISLPLVGDVPVAGLSPPMASVEIAKRLNGLVVDPHVVISLAGGRESTCNVTGEVRQGGSFPIKAGDGVLELIARAGGLSEFADRNDIYVVRKRDGVRIRFSYDRLMRADGPAAKFQLQDGDTIIVE